MDDNTAPDLKAERELVFAQIGRNVFAYQRVEHLLRMVVRNSDISWTPGTPIEQFLETHGSEIANKTMGCVAGKLLEGPLLQNGTTKKRSPTPKDARAIRLQTHIDLPDGERVKFEQELAILVSERNSLIHKSILLMQLDSVGTCRNEFQRLVEQRARIDACSDRLLGFVRSFHSLLEICRAPEFAKILFKGGTISMDGTLSSPKRLEHPESESGEPPN